MGDGRTVVVLVDDETAITRGLARIVGYALKVDTITAMNAEEALFAIREHRPTHVVSDWNMGPGMNGGELHARVLEDLGHDEMPKWAFHCSGNREVTSYCERHGILLFEKPSGFEEILDFLR